MECPLCNRPTRVLESRRAAGGDATRRRRECSACGHRFTTFERREPEPSYVASATASASASTAAKLRAALLRSTHKRQVERGQTSRRWSTGSSLAIETAGGELAASGSASSVSRDWPSSTAAPICSSSGPCPEARRTRILRSRRRPVPSGPSGRVHRYPLKRAEVTESLGEEELEDVGNRRKHSKFAADGPDRRAPLHDPRGAPVRRGRVGDPRRGHRRPREPGLRAARGRVPARPGRRTRPTSSPRSTSAARSAPTSARTRSSR